MLIIGICDGDLAVRTLLSDFIKRYREETGLTVTVLSYDNGEKLLRHYPLEMDLIFLEIPFARLSGIEIARRIREADEHVSIIFLTTMLSHVLEAYDVRADNYLLKPLRYTRFLKEAEAARARRGQNRFLIENNDDGVYKIYTKTIRYIETDGRKTKIHSASDTCISYKTMKAHAEVLFEPYFVRCHTGFIVNLLFFEKLEQNDLLLITGEKIPVSRQRKREVLNRIKSLYENEVSP
ncbi:MAG: LytTR family DNA-binding domain-containing protein [Defluviitaleaceae bacterium]|nr:LytTR family DNA-binding domain-containing protein [Defluviitaleaceae bacterium]